MQPGTTVVTCFSGLDTNNQQSNPNGFVMGVYDISTPDCNAAGITDDSITPNAFNNWQAASVGVYHDASWTARNLGEIFGIDIADNETNPNIYVTSDGFTANIEVGLTLPTGASGGDV